MIKWDLSKYIGYTPITNYWDRFNELDENKKTIQNLARTIYLEAKSDVKLYTEFVMVLNHRSWGYYNINNSYLSEIYAYLYHKYWDFALDYFKGEDLNYLIRTLD